jgi:anti-sigma regulatory factor (Ser/Thr protein kinase)
VEDKARVVGYTRMIRRAIRRDGLQTETGRAEIAHWKGELLELLRSTDTLLFDRNELEIEAVRENLEEVLAFLGERLDAADCTPKARMQLELAVEEIFINIASYAYNPETGKATVRIEVSGDPLHVTITFIDRGIPYDPLAKADPDLSASAQERTVGGLGIFLTKKLMDDVVYEYRGGRNVLTLKKNLE